MNLPALKVRNFKFFLSTHVFMMIGDWLISLAMLWMAYRMTENPFLMTVISSLTLFPHLIFAPFVGPLADSSNRRIVIFWGQLAIVVLLLAYAMISFIFGLNYLLLAIMAGLYGSIWAVMSPSIYGFTLDMVGPECYINANSITRATFSLARIVGPIIGGFLFEARNGWGWCFLVAGLLMIPELYMLANIRVECKSVRREGSIWSNFVPGIRHIFEKKTPVYILSVIALAALLGYSGNILIAPICEDILKMPEIKGIMSATVGIGAFFGAMAISFLANNRNGLKIFRYSAMTFPILGILIGLMVWLRQPIPMALLYMCFGAVMVATNVMGSNLIPVHVDKEFVGRSLGLYNVSLMGILPFGDLLTGFVSSMVAIPFTIAGLHGVILVPMLLLVAWLSRKVKAGKA
jgi:MFS family permease